MTDKARPIHEMRLQSVKAAIWQNGPTCNVTFSKLYKDGDGKWQQSTSFGRDDLLLLAKIADECHTWICEQAVSGSSGAGCE